VYRFLLTRRWIGIQLTALLMIPALIWLGFWQLHRYEDAAERNTRIARNMSAVPVPVAELTGPGRTVPERDLWRRVTVTGRYDTAHEVVARNRTGTERGLGFFVITPMILDDGSSVLVNRGWVVAPDTATAYPKVPAAPSGTVRVTGRLRASETAANSGRSERSGLPDRQIMQISSERAERRIPGRTILGGYVELTGSNPQPGRHPEPVGEPKQGNTGLHLAYSVQWWLFAAAVPFGWWKLVRRERLDRAKSPAAGTGGGGAGGDAADGAGQQVQTAKSGS
jgi:cytochrome oxidase assembly protein ShyY1